MARDRTAYGEFVMRTLAARALREWMASERVSGRDLCKRIGCSHEYLSHLRRDKATPGLALAFAIERESRGAVPARAWVSSSSDGAQAAKSEA